MIQILEEIEADIPLLQVHVFHSKATLRIGLGSITGHKIKLLGALRG